MSLTATLFNSNTTFGPGVEVLGFISASASSSVDTTTSFTNGSLPRTLLENDLAVAIMVNTDLTANAGESDMVVESSAAAGDYTGSTYASSENTATTDRCQVKIFYKFMGSTPDTQVYVPLVYSGDTVGFSSVIVYFLRNVDTSTPFDVTTTTATANNVGTITTPSLTISTQGSVVIQTGNAGGNSMDDLSMDNFGTSTSVPVGFYTQIVSSGSEDLSSIAVVNYDKSGTPALPVFREATTSGALVSMSMALRPKNPPIY
jgi:hypothetical protein